MWAQYGLAGVLEHEAFVRDVIGSATRAGIAIEQLHPEYGANQFELSLAPQPPVAAADQLILMRLIIGRAAAGTGSASACHPHRSPVMWDPVLTNTFRCPWRKGRCSPAAPARRA